MKTRLMRFEFNSLITPIFKFITWPAKDPVSDTKLQNQVLTVVTMG